MLNKLTTYISFRIINNNKLTVFIVNIYYKTWNRNSDYWKLVLYALRYLHGELFND